MVGDPRLDKTTYTDLDRAVQGREHRGQRGGMGGGAGRAPVLRKELQDWVGKRGKRSQVPPKRQGSENLSWGWELGFTPVVKALRIWKRHLGLMRCRTQKDPSGCCLENGGLRGGQETL